MSDTPQSSRRPRVEHRRRRLGRRVFISYSSCDAVARELVDAIESRGISCFLASRDIPPGVKWERHLVRAIDDACVLIFIEDAASVASRHCYREVALADERGIFLIRVRREAVGLSEDLAFYFVGRQWFEHSTLDLEALVDLIESKGVAPIQRLRTGDEPLDAPQLELVLSEAEAARLDGEDSLAEHLYDVAVDNIAEAEFAVEVEMAGTLGAAFAALQRGDLPAATELLRGEPQSMEAVAATAAERARQAARLFLLRRAASA